MKTPRIIIHVEGGVVQDITCDQPVEVYLCDQDNIDGGDEMDKELFPTDDVASSAFDKILNNLIEDSKKNKPYRKTSNES